MPQKNNKVSSPQNPYDSWKSGSPLKNTFPKKEKLTHKKHFEQLFREGKSIYAFPVKLLYLPAIFDNDTHIKVAVTAPKRKFKRAVHRNRIKRLLREAYRLNKPLIFGKTSNSFAFLFLYLGNQLPTYKEVDTAMKKLLQAFPKIANNRQGSS